MRAFLVSCLAAVLSSFVSGQNPFSIFAQRFVPGLNAKSAEGAKKTLVELGRHFTDSSKIINITDSNWEAYLGHQSYGEWLVEFTAKPEHCASCEIIDLAFNDASHRLAVAHSELGIGRVDCSEEIILSTKFLITKPPTLFHISPSRCIVRKLPPHVAMPEDLVRYYNAKEWLSETTWEGMWNPLGEGFGPKALNYVGVGLKAYAKAVDGLPRWLGLLLMGALTSFILKWLHGNAKPAADQGKKAT